MKKFFTKLKWVLISAACACFAVTGYLKTFRPSAESAAEAGDNVAIPVDMYLIAGQSNAAGYSPVYANETETFENVWYAGMTEKALRSDRESYSSNSMTSFASFKRSVKAGLGNNGSRIGPEYGMASVLNEMYADANRKAMILNTCIISFEQPQDASPNSIISATLPPRAIATSSNSWLLLEQ